VVVEKDFASMVVRLVQFWNALIEMAKWLCGKCTEIRDMQPENAQSPMVLMVDGNVTAVKDEHSQKK